MSTTQSSDEGKVLMLDPPDVILRKFKRAVTDSGSEIVARSDKPGVSNLLDILSAITGSRRLARSRPATSARATARSRSMSPRP